MEVSKLKEKIKDFQWYAKNCLKIRTITSEVIPFELNATQRIVLAKIQEIKAQNKPVRLVILKARRQGISTLTEGLIFHDTATRKHRRAKIIAHEPDATNEIFGMTKFFHDNLPEGFDPMKRFDNAKRLVFENPDEEERKTKPGLDSSLEVSTASKLEVRGQTVHDFHASEVAFWKNAETLMLAALQQVPSHADTMVILESTANGVGGYFHDMYWKAKGGKNDFLAIFLAWFIFPDYVRPIEPGFKLNAEEVDMKKAFNLTDEQLNWRRWCIANQCGGDELKFKQEYPSTDREAFIVSGTPRFNTQNLAVYYDSAPKPKFIGELNSEDKPECVQAPELHKLEKGRLRIYQWPNPAHSYVIGGDTAKGTEWSDNSALQVIDKHTGDQVATWKGKIDPTKLAYLAARLGFFYRGGQDCALIGIEVNKDGITTNKVLQSEIKYPKLYRRRTVDRTTEKNEFKLGFHTNERSRELILNKLARWINEGEFALNDEATIMECMTFTYDENGKAQAQEGSHDDCVMSLAIAIHLFDYNIKVEPPKTDLDKLREQMKAKKQQPAW